MAAVDDSYLQYKHNFASVRLRFEEGMSQAEAGSPFHGLTQHISLEPLKTSVAQKTEYANANVDSEAKHQPSLDLQTPPTTPTTPQESLLPLGVGVRCEAEVQTDPRRETPLSVEPHFVDHGCQTDEELEYESGPSSLLEPEQLPREGTRRVSPARDQEIQVTQDDLVNPLKRIVSQRTRRYDLLEEPHLKRRVYQRRSDYQRRRRTHSASDVPWQQLWSREDLAEKWSGPEGSMAWGEPEVGAAWSRQVAEVWNKQMATAMNVSAVPEAWARPGLAEAWARPGMAEAWARSGMAEEWTRPGMAEAWRGSEMGAAWSRQVAAAWNKQMAAARSVEAVPEAGPRPEAAGAWAESDVDEVFSDCLEEALSAPSGSFGLSDSSPLVASLRSLVQGLPSAYPEELPHDDLADLDQDNFSSINKDEMQCRARRPVPRSRVAAPSKSPVRVYSGGG